MKVKQLVYQTYHHILMCMLQHHVDLTPVSGWCSYLEQKEGLERMCWPWRLSGRGAVAKASPSELIQLCPLHGWDLFSCPFSRRLFELCVREEEGAALLTQSFDNF